MDSVTQNERSLTSLFQCCREAVFERALLLDQKSPISLPYPCSLYKMTNKKLTVLLLWLTNTEVSSRFMQAPTPRGRGTAARRQEDRAGLPLPFASVTVSYRSLHSLFMCLTEFWTQNAVIRHTALVIRRQMIERYGTEKKERGTMKSLWKKTKQRWENYLFQKPASVF